MRLKEYIRAADSSLKDFSDRTGIPLSTLDRIAREESRCRIDIAERIVIATKEQPTLSGGFVTFEELVPSKSAA